MDLITAADERLKAGDVHERAVKAAPSKLESNIITTAKELKCLHNWLEEDGSEGQLELLYRGSRDGFAGTAFHSKCNDRGSTLTVIETTDGYVLGGYSNTPWSSSRGYKQADKAFLFVLSGSDVVSPCKMELKDEQDDRAVYHEASLGPTFGRGQGLDQFMGYIGVLVGPSGTYEPWPAGHLSKRNASFTIKEIEVFRWRIVGVIERENIRSQPQEVIDDQALSPLPATANNVPSRRKLGKRKGETDAADDGAANAGGEAAAKKKREKKKPKKAAPTSNATANATHVADAAGNGRPAEAQGSAPKCTPTEAAADAALKIIQEDLSNVAEVAAEEEKHAVDHAAELEEELSKMSNVAKVAAEEKKHAVDHAAELEEELSKMSNVAKVAAEEKKHAVDHAAELEEELSKLSNVAKVAAEEKKHAIDHAAELEEELSKLSNVVKIAAEEKKHAIDHAAELEAELSTSKASEAQWKAGCVRLEEELSKLSNVAKVATEEKKHAVDHAAELEEELSMSKASEAQWKAGCARSEKEKANLEGGFRRMQSHNERIQRTNRGLKGDNEGLKALCVAKDEEIKNLARENQTLNRKLGEMERQDARQRSSNRSHARGSGNASGNESRESEMPEELRAHAKWINNEIVEFGEKISLADIAGLEDAKRNLWEAVILPLKNPSLFSGPLAKPINGMLLFGPPGTGKSMIGKAIAHECDATFFSISKSSIDSKWQGDGEARVRTLFSVAHNRAPSVVFIDEVDSMLTQRESGEGNDSRGITTEFLRQMEGVGNERPGRVLVMGATNTPWDLDSGVRRRFVKRLLIPPPALSSRKAVIKNLLGKSESRHCLNDDQMSQLSRDTEGFSGADLTSLCQAAALGPVRQMADERGKEAVETMRAEDFPLISYEHFRNSLGRMNPSVAPSEVALHEEWNAKWGNV
ncbi:hypothetical protein ACHAXT_001772 [Thalassiosira profunda]